MSHRIDRKLENQFWKQEKLGRLIQRMKTQELQSLRGKLTSGQGATAANETTANICHCAQDSNVKRVTAGVPWSRWYP